MRTALATACIAVGMLAGATVAQAATYDLTSDFSSANNPNGPWSFVYNGSPLGHVDTPTANGNALIPAIPAAGYFSTGPNLNDNTPDVLQAAVNGSAAGGTNLDFLAGDVIIHTPNDGSALSIVWKAPSAGTVNSFIASAWYAHSAVNRSNNVSYSIAGVLQSGFSTSSGAAFNRNAAGTFSSGGFSVNAGDLITLDFVKTAGQQFGSLTGVTEIIDFTAAVAPTPIPGALPLFAAGLAGLGWVGHRRRKHAA
jgi:hypothetical protein